MVGGSGSFKNNNSIKHFDPCTNKVPDNFFGDSVKTGYYSFCAWKRCMNTYGPNNSCKENSDKWNICNNCSSKWTKDCGKKKNGHYFNSYKGCGDCGDCGDCYNACYDPNIPCSMCDPCCNNPCKKYMGCPPGCCLPCCKPCVKSTTTYVKSNCNDCCQQVAIVFRGGDESIDCDNIVELSLPIGGTKESYLAAHFPQSFVKKNKYQCATVPYINECPNNLIDNMREQDFTISDQKSLTMRGVKSYEAAKLMQNKGAITNDRYKFRIESDACGKTAYYKLGNCNNVGSTEVGLLPSDQAKGYFGLCNC